MSSVSSPLRPEWLKIPQAAFRDKYRQLDSLHDVAAFWEEIAPSQLSYYAYHVDKKESYRTFPILRRNGKERIIEAPNPTLKYIQRLIHESLTQVYGPHPAVHGFRSKRSIVTNARNHLGRSYVLNVDIADFFPTITRKRIYGRLIAAPYSLNEKVANLIAALSTNFFEQLPQGSPSSPIIANILTAELDNDLA